MPLSVCGCATSSTRVDSCNRRPRLATQDHPIKVHESPRHMDFQWLLDYSLIVRDHLIHIQLLRDRPNSNWKHFYLQCICSEWSENSRKVILINEDGGIWKSRHDGGNPEATLEVHVRRYGVPGGQNWSPVMSNSAHCNGKERKRDKVHCRDE